MRAYYSAPVADFIRSSEDAILGAIASSNEHELELTQRNAWLAQIQILKEQLFEVDGGHIFFEFSIPRMGKRADVIYLNCNAVFVLEFKVGASSYHSGDIAQVVDYSVDLKNFHEGSHKLDVIPILIATAAPDVSDKIIFREDRVADCLRSNATTLRATIISTFAHLSNHSLLTADDWMNAGYKPTPTIIEAAQALYRDHDVAEISRSDASAKNLTETTEAIGAIIEAAKAKKEKVICFVTGVPGAGKTLAGLNITTKRMNRHEDEHAVFLSGNGPLVAVLRCALAKDESKRLSISLADAKRNANAFIQNIHHFRDSNLETIKPTVERVVVFDEAQRAWDREHTVKFMRTKKNQPDFNASEPEFLIEVMDRHSDWCVIVALIGGGQEINSGEAGLPEWFDALRARFADWKVYYSDRISSKEYTKEIKIETLVSGLNARSSNCLHLGVSLRSFRAESLSDFVKHLINNSPDEARKCYEKIRENYPIFISRDINAAKQWLVRKKRGTQLFGMIASSGAKRLRPEGMNVGENVDPEEWFLNGADDVRACQYLEEVATEFDIQGLELDWAVMGWDANLRRGQGGWEFFKFRGTKWQEIHGEIDRQYLLNAYRVLLTRARQGFVIYIPNGDQADPTRSPHFYEPIFSYLKCCGIPSL
jgi:hypothetical protein